ncbi:MAG TPA: hypothetical protein PKV43_03170 [Armatimonadota bacterium]|nr:hypothetical protein [Armatimonadota bacterium]
MANCPECAAENEAEAGLCQECSSPLPGSDAVEPANQRGRRRLFKILALTFLVVAIIGGSGFAYWKYIYLPQQPVIAVQSFISMVVEGDMAEARQYLTKDASKMFEFAKAIAGVDVEAELKEIFSGGGEKSFRKGIEYELKLVEYKPERAQVNFKPGPKPAEAFREDNLPPNCKNGIPVIVVKQDGEWKIDLMQTYLVINGEGS